MPVLFGYMGYMGAPCQPGSHDPLYYGHNPLSLLNRPNNLVSEHQSNTHNTLFPKKWEEYRFNVFTREANEGLPPNIRSRCTC